MRARTVSRERDTRKTGERIERRSIRRNTATISVTLLASLSLLLVLLSAPPSAAWYLPGLPPRDYAQGDSVPLLTNALTPQIGSKAQLRSVLSYDYYSPKFHFCQPQDGPVKQPEALGSILFGDRIFNSPFDLRMLKNTTCKPLCASTVPSADASFINDRIREDYAVNFLVDGLPAAEMKKDDKSGEIFYSIGFELGSDEGIMPLPSLNNHYDIYLEYHTKDHKTFRVVGVVVWPRSISSYKPGVPAPDCATNQPQQLSESAETKLFYTYSVYWTASSTPWATRWDNYLHVFDPRIHWFSLINSLVIALFLCVMVAMILIRTVHKDINRYNAIDLSEDVQEDFGWKLVHGEVFRPPSKSMLLSILVGSGAQLTAMVCVTLVFALFGFLSPSNRGSLSTVMIVCWTLFGTVAGYVSARLYAGFRGEAWKRNAVGTAVGLPTVLFGALNLLNFFLIGAGSSGAVPFGTLLAVVALWFCISGPLTLVGSVLGVRKGPIDHPVRVNQIPRQIPPLVWYLKPWPSALMAGILPFGSVFIELFFILSSLFGSKAYYAFGFLALTFGVAAITTSLVTILMCYFVLCAENYQWHWRAFVTGGGSAFWLLAYGLLYWASRLSLDGAASRVLYLGYLLLIALMDFLITGTIGFVSCYYFLTKIYSQIRID